MGFCALLVILLTGTAHSGPSDSISMERLVEMPINELLDLEVVTASKTARSFSDITQKIDIISRQQIERTVTGNRNIAEYIQYLPGASVRVLSRNDANWGAYGGIGPKYSTYMVQGLPIDGFIDPQSLDIMAVKHIEVQRGPASVLYPNYLSQDYAGNQSPLAGTVNLILKEQVDKPRSLVSAGYGSYNTYSGRLYHENTFNGLNLLGGITLEKSDYTDYGSENSWLNMLKNPCYEKGKLFINANMALDKKKQHELGLFGNQTFHRGDFGRKNREYLFNYSLMNVRYSGEVKKDVTVNVKTGLRRYDKVYQDDHYNTETLDQSLKETSNVRQVIIPSDVSIGVLHYNNSNATIGADYQYASYRTSIKEPEKSSILGNDAIVSQLGIYVQEELKLHKLVLRGGARYNRISYDISKIGGVIPGSEHENWNVFLWSTGIKYNLNEELSLYGNAGNSFMSPALKSIGGTLPASEKFIAGSNGQVPNPDLEPEEGLSVDCGFNYMLPLNVSLSSRVFYTILTDAIIDNDISLDSTHSQSMSINAAGKTIGRGGEFGIYQQIDEKIDWFANLSYTLSEIDSPEDVDQDGVQVPFVPGMMNNVGVTLYLPYAIEISFWAHFGGIIYDNSSKSGRKSYDSGEDVNIHALKTFHLSENRIMTAFVKVYNITDNTFMLPWQFQDPGRSVTAGVKVTF